MRTRIFDSFSPPILFTSLTIILIKLLDSIINNIENEKVKAEIYHILGAMNKKKMNAQIDPNFFVFGGDDERYLPFILRVLP